MRVGVVLPTFVDDPSVALAAARQIEAAGLHGCFSFDHLWPVGQPGRPSLSAFPLLGAVAQVTSRVALGPLVARVGLASAELLVREFVTLDALSGRRVIAAIGTGDEKSDAEQRAFGLDVPSRSQRRARVRSLATALRREGLVTWIGGRAAATRAIASELALTANLWRAAPEELAAVGEAGAVSWSGPLASEEPAAQLAALAAAGASWAVVMWPGGLEPLIASCEAAGIALGAPPLASLE